MADHEWNWKHPNIQASFYEKITAPISLDDAQIKMSCHEHAIKDFDLQLEMNTVQMDMLKENGEVIPYELDNYGLLEEKKLKLLSGKRFHQNAYNSYWYWVQQNKVNK
jgi:hypothetical protein